MKMCITISANTTKKTTKKMRKKYMREETGLQS